MDVAGKVIAVTGGARGIGRAMAERFVNADAKAVVIADVNTDAAMSAAREIGAHAVQCDVSRESDVEGLIENTEKTHGPIDLFCSNAGILVGGGPEARDEDWRRIWDINVMAHIYVARHLVPRMLDRKRGYILGTVSAAGLLNVLFAAPYGVTKAAALSLFEWLAIEYGDRGLRVSCLCPQGVKTDMLEAGRGEGHDFLVAGALAPEAVAEAVLESVAAERFLILPHPEVAEYFQRKATDYDRWLRGMRRLRAGIVSASP
jgi:NAD(P)-dependent dehydrogenase (short-subunit alcohol dehydrogenase family)